MNIYNPATAALGLTACLLTLGLAPRSAHAERPSQEELETFKQLVKEGSELRDGDKSWAALEKLQRAKDILDHPKLAFNIGKLHQKTGACGEAKQAYTDILARPKLPDDLRTEVAEQLRAAEDCESFATIELTCEPEDARVKVEANRFDCPVRQKVSPGDLQIEVDAAGHQPRTLAKSLQPGELAAEQVKLQPGESLHKPELADGDGGAVDGPTPWMTYAAYSSVGVGGALLIGGIVSDYSAQSRAEDFVAANQDGNRQRAQALQSEADSAQGRTIALYSVGAILVGGGVALWVYEAQSEGAETPTVSTEIGWAADAPAVRGVLKW